VTVLAQSVAAHPVGAASRVVTTTPLAVVATIRCRGTSMVPAEPGSPSGVTGRPDAGMRRPGHRAIALPHPGRRFLTTRNPSFLAVS